MRIWSSALLGLELTLSLLAQSGMVSAEMSSSGRRFSGSMQFSPVPFVETPVTGAPYSAQRVSEHVQTAADGTRFTRSSPLETIYRDSQGRTRTERRFTMDPSASDAPVIVEISDPVANVRYTLDTWNKVAHRVANTADAGVAAGGGGVRTGVLQAVAPIPADSSPPHAVTAKPAPPATANNGFTAASARLSGLRGHPEFTTDDLGTQMVEGVTAKGERHIQTWPAGSQGNDRPFQTTSETWISPELKIVLLSRSVDPRSGEHTMKLVNVSRAEPDPTLFAPPPDFTIVDETGPFEIRWTGSR